MQQLLLRRVAYQCSHAVANFYMLQMSTANFLSCFQVVREGDYAEVIEPGQYVVYAGGSQPGDDKAPANVLMGSFEMGGDETPLSQCS